MDLLILGDVLITACTIMSAAYKEVSRWEGGGEGKGGLEVEEEGGWVNDASRHRRPSYVHSEPNRWPPQP